FVGALGCALNVQLVRLARSLRAPPRSCTLLSSRLSLHRSDDVASVFASILVVVAIVVVVATVLVLVSIGRGDVGVDEQREKLTALDQLSVGARLVGLDVEQEPSGSQDVGGVDDSRSLLVLRDERWSARLGRIEERGIVMGDLEELAGRDLISPDLGHARVVAGVLVHD